MVEFRGFIMVEFRGLIMVGFIMVEFHLRFHHGHHPLPDSSTNKSDMSRWNVSHCDSMQTTCQNTLRC